MIQERECCGTFEGTPHRTTCRPNLLKEISRLKAELAEFKQWQKEDHDKLVQQVQTIDVLEQELQKTQLQLMQEETDRKIWQQDCKKVEAQLSRYAGAVAVEGLFDVQYGLNLCSSETHKLDNLVRYGKVRVLIMKLEG